MPPMGAMSSAARHETTPLDGKYTESAWREWKQLCALARCAEEHQQLLRDFGGRRLLHYLKIGSTRRDGWNESGRDAWHLLETHMQVTHTRAGKRYKDWLFDRIVDHSNKATWLPAVEAGASLMLRDIARNLLRQEYTSAQVPSNVAELLPDPGDSPETHASEQDLRAIAIQMAGTVLHQLSPLEQQVLWVRSHGISFWNEALQEITQCSRSRLQRHYLKTLKTLAVHVEKNLPQDTPKTWLDVTCKTIDELTRHLRVQLERDNSPLVAFINGKEIQVREVAHHAE